MWGNPVARMVDSLGGPAATAAEPAEPSGRRWWFALPCLATAALLTITTQLTTNVAAIPFLWVAPLMLYLLSFILCFDGEGWYWRRFYYGAALVSPVLMLASGHFHLSSAGVVSGPMPLVPSVLLHCAGLFAICMVCHGELARLKPQPRKLTRFYLSIAAGGALGGAWWRSLRR